MNDQLIIIGINNLTWQKELLRKPPNNDSKSENVFPLNMGKHHYPKRVNNIINIAFRYFKIPTHGIIKSLNKDLLLLDYDQKRQFLALILIS